MRIDKRRPTGFHSPIPSPPRKILFVCTGNTCRSPMAEALLRHALAGEAGWEVLSAGVAARPGAPASKETAAILAETGIDTSGHRSRLLSAELVHSAFLILAMTDGHREVVLELFPEAADRVSLLGDFAEDPGLREIPDPIGGGKDAYIETRDAIVAAIPSLLDHIRNTRAIEEAGDGER